MFTVLKKVYQNDTESGHKQMRSNPQIFPKQINSFQSKYVENESANQRQRRDKPVVFINQLCDEV